MADALRGGIVINEILVDPNGSINYDTDGNGTAADNDEFVELYNTSNSAINISGLQLWDGGVGKWFTFPTGSILQPGAHAMVMIGVQSGGSLPSGGPNDLFFNAGRGSALINNTGDNVIVYDPTANTYIAATFNGDALDNPPAGGSGYTGFSTTATLVGAGENFGYDTDGQSLQRRYDGTNTIKSGTPTPGTQNICFVGGTHFDTPHGPRVIESFKRGDLVNTLDHGPQPVKWIFSKTWSQADVAQNPALAPILISRDTLGPGLPGSDLRLSRQHRVMVTSAIAKRMLLGSEVLVAAKNLLPVPGVVEDGEAIGVTYFHIMFDRHELVLANGLPVESLFLGAEALNALSQEAVAELEQLLDQTIDQLRRSSIPSARPIVTGKAAKSLIARHLRHTRPLQAPPPKAAPRSKLGCAQFA